jgi:hypothetical protein
MIDHTATRISEHKESEDSKSFPNRKQEIWRYVNTSTIGSFSQLPTASKQSSSQDHSNIGITVSHFSGNQFYGDLPDDIMASFTETSQPISTKDHIADKNYLFTAGNTPTLTIKKNSVSEHTLCINPDFESINWNRLHINAEQGSECELNIEYFGENQTHESSTEISINIEKGAILKISFLNISNDKSLVLQGVDATLNRDARLEILDLDSNIKATRSRYNINLNGENAEVKLTGCAILSDKNQSHHYLEVNHNAPHCRSFQFFKKLLLDTSRASFDGTVFVKEGASGTEANQLNNNLLLSETARVYAKPRMKIKASDVKCNHGATTGSLEDDQIFYLISRGINNKDAIKALALGFIKEALNDCNHKNVSKWWLDSYTNLLTKI